MSSYTRSSGLDHMTSSGVGAPGGISLSAKYKEAEATLSESLGPNSGSVHFSSFFYFNSLTISVHLIKHEISSFKIVHQGVYISAALVSS